MNKKHKIYFYFDEETTKRFKIWLLENNYTLKTFAEKIGLSYHTLRRIVVGDISLSAKYAELLDKNGFNVFNVGFEINYGL